MGYKCEAIIEKVKAKLAAVDPDPSKRTILSVYLFQITVNGDEVKRYIIDMSRPAVLDGDAKVAVDVTVTIDDEVLAKLLTKAITLDEAMKAGTIAIKGGDDAIPNMKKLVAKLIE